MSTSGLVRFLHATQVVAMITTRPDGTERATPIWAVVVDDVPYLRSVEGPDAGWFRRALSGRPVAFSLEDGALAERDSEASLHTARAGVRLERVADHDPVQAAIDAELAAKYRTEPQDVEPMVREPATSTTVRVVAA